MIGGFVERAISMLLVVVGLINLTPVAGVLSVDAMTRAYGIPIAGSDIEILMRHRALLLGIIGVLLVSAAFNRSLQLVAIAAALVSMLGFIAVAASTGGYGDGIRRVVLIDAVGIVLLLIAIALRATAKGAPV